MLKYTHVFNFSSLTFDRAIVEMICENPLELSLENTCFVVINREEYENLKDYPNVLYDSDNDIINKYCECSQAVIVHGFSSMTQILKIKKKNLHKIIWRTWGSDTGYVISDKRIIVNIYKRFINVLRKIAVKQLMAVGVCNIVDEIDIKNKFGIINTIEVPYFKNERVQIENERIKKNNHDGVSFLIGHSGMSTDNHLQIIDKLAKYKEYNCKFFFVLSYGYADYIANVKAYARQKLGEKAVFICEKMNYLEYLQFLNQMDLVVFDGKQSYALGNIGALLLMKKKFVLNENGVIRKAFDAEAIPYITSELLGKIEYTELIKKVDYNADESNMVIHDYEGNRQLWKNIVDFINTKVDKHESN